MPATRTFTIDADLDDDRPWSVGDVLVTPRAFYVVVFFRPVDSTKWPNRWRVEARRVDEVEARRSCRNGGLWRETNGYRRGETPEQFYGRSAAEIDAAFGR